MFQQAADQGLVEAHNDLGLMYMKGRRVPKAYQEANDKKAVELFQQRAEQGEGDVGAKVTLG